jgi:diguanylate cyclase (GGDEF)-like protein
MLAEVLRDSIAAINSTLDYDRLLDIILNNLALVVPHDAASIAILDKDGMIRVERSRGYKDLQLEEFIQSMRVPLTFFPNWKRVFQDQIVLNVPDVRSEKDWVYLPETSWIRSYLCAPIVIKNQVIGIFNLDSSQPRFFSSESAKRLQAFAHQAAIAIEKTNLFRETQRLAITDGLTGIYNNRHIMDLTERELKRAKRYQRHLCAILFDLDFFKQVNDRFGHLTGNMVLQTVTRLCSASVRESDLIGRYGGEEFLIITPETDIAEAAEIAERLRQGIEKMRIPTEKGDVHVTISLGVATCEPGSDLSLQELIRRVDEALYVSKAKGRNCVSLWEDNPTAV